MCLVFAHREDFLLVTIHMNWRDTITAHSARLLIKRDVPLALKDLAFKLIWFAVRCGRSHPVSFALRPLVTHKRLRVAVGVNLAILAVFLAIYGPLPTFAGDSVGGPLEVNVRSEGEVNLATVESVQVPVANYRLTQGYSWYHPGVDLAAVKGEPIRPVMAGQVDKVESGRFGYGNNVAVTHANGYQSLYAHLSKIEVQEGQGVTLETEIGQVGSTGRSSGPHLHLEISAAGSPVNPKSLLDLK